MANQRVQRKVVDAGRLLTTSRKHVLRMVKPSDREPLRELYRLIHDPAVRGFNQDEAAYSLAYDEQVLATDMADPFAHYTRSSRTAFFVLESGKIVVGSSAVDIWPDDDAVAELKRVAVRPEYRGRGLGRLLVSTSEDWARANGFKALRFHTLDAQKEAIALYESMRFVLVRRHQWGPLSGREYQKTFA